MTTDDERHVVIMNILRQRCSLLHPPRLSSVPPQRGLILHFPICGDMLAQNVSERLPCSMFHPKIKKRHANVRFVAQF
jgi:hypothetical protein